MTGKEAVRIIVTKGNGDSEVLVEETLEHWVIRTSREAGAAAAKVVLDEYNKTRLQSCPVKDGLAKKVGEVNIKVLVLAAFLTGLGILNVIGMLK